MIMGLRPTSLAFLALACAVVIAPLAVAEDSEDFTALEAARARVAAVEDSLSLARDRLDAVMQEGRATSKQLDELQAEAVAAGFAIRQHEKDLALLEGELQRWQGQEEAESTAFERENKNLAALLGVLARIARLPAEPMILGEGDANSQVRTALTTRSVIDKVETKAADLRTRLERLTRVRTQVQQRLKDTERARTTLSARITALDSIIAARREVRDSDEQRQAAAQARVEDLIEESGEVGEILRSLEAEIVRRAALAALDPPIASVPTETLPPGPLEDGLGANDPLAALPVIPGPGRSEFGPPERPIVERPLVEPPLAEPPISGSPSANPAPAQQQARLFRVPDPVEEEPDSAASQEVTAALPQALAESAAPPAPLNQDARGLPPEADDILAALPPEEITAPAPALVPGGAIPQPPDETGGAPDVVGLTAPSPNSLPNNPSVEATAPLPNERPREERTPGETSDLAILTPVAGDIALGFGDQDAFGQVHKGMTIKAASQVPVLSPLDGTVRFAGPFQEYGRLLIVEHEGGYHSLIAGLGRIDVSVGQEVLSGEPIGATPAPQTTGIAVDIYYELRQGGVPINPIRGLELAQQRGEG